MIKNIFLGAAIASSLVSPAVFANDDNRDISFGVGLGIPYAVLGANLSVRLNDHVDLTAALGTTGKLAWSSGVRLYPMADSNFRLSAYYGVNGAVQVERCGRWSCDDPEWETFTGFSTGIGWGAHAGDRGFTADLMYIVTSGVYDEVDRLEDEGYDVDGSNSRVKFSLGYQF